MARPASLDKPHAVLLELLHFATETPYPGTPGRGFLTTACGMFLTIAILRLRSLTSLELDYTYDLLGTSVATKPRLKMKLTAEM